MNIGTHKALLIKWNEAYRAGKEIVSDAEFDRQLAKLSEALSYDEYEKFRISLFEEKGTITNAYVLGSLNKFKYEEPEKFLKWIMNNKLKTLFVSDKIDGLSFYAEYRKGKLTLLSSRGDGAEGVDWTPKAKYINIPQSISSKEPLDIRGEVSLIDNDFQTLGYTTKRNGTAGIMNSKDIEPEKLKYVYAFAYEVLSGSHTVKDQFSILQNNNFRTSAFREFKITGDLIDELKGCYLTRQEISPYDIDGLVISDPSYKPENEMLPKGKVAFKVNSEGYKTTIVDIEWNLSKSGAYKPVLILEPVNMNGVTVSRANGCNAQMMKDKGTGIGAEVLVIRSGEVIPRVIDVTSKVAPVMPVKCPSCGEKLTWKGVDIVCNNNCGDAMVLKVTSFLRDCGVENVTEKSLLKWNIIDFESLLSFRPDTKSKAQVKFAESLIKNIFNKSALDLFSNMYFDGAGTKTILKVVEFYGNGSINQAGLHMFNKPSSYPEGIGQKTIDKMKSDWTWNEKILTNIIMDKRYTYTEQEKPMKNEETGSLPLTGKTFLFTGTLSQPRKVFETKVVNAGGSIASSVSKNLDYLVVGLDAGSKLAKAIKLNIETLSEKEFEEMIK